MTAEISQIQVPGVYRHRAGTAMVTALNDGFLVIPYAYLSGITEAEGDAIRMAAGRRPPFASAINAYAVQWPGRTVLVDTGSGAAMGPTAGRFPASMAAAGLVPGEVDAVLMTHLHVDHMSGLVDADGAPAFPNADVLVPQVELDFWLNEANAAAAPEALKGVFAAAKSVLAPYGGRVKGFAAEAAPLPGVDAVALPGHTVGHTGYFVGDGEERVLIWGDIFHVPDLQSRRPEVTIGFDSDPAQAEATRRSILARAAAEGFVVAGMHMHFPGFSRIAAAGDGFAVLPLPWRVEV